MDLNGNSGELDPSASTGEGKARSTPFPLDTPPNIFRATASSLFTLCGTSGTNSIKENDDDSTFILAHDRAVTPDALLQADRFSSKSRYMSKEIFGRGGNRPRAPRLPADSIGNESDQRMTNHALSPAHVKTAVKQFRFRITYNLTITSLTLYDCQPRACGDLQ
jgi:hypothetical protein